MLDSHRVEDMSLNLSLVFAITHIDLEHLTLSILLHTLPNLLLSSDRHIMLTDPRGYTLAKYCVLVITAAQTARSAQKGILWFGLWDIEMIMFSYRSFMLDPLQAALHPQRDINEQEHNN